MTPAQEFRRWLRRGPVEEKVITGFIALVALTVLSLSLVPSGSPGTGTSMAGADVTGAPATSSGGASSSGAPAASATAVGGTPTASAAVGGASTPTGQSPTGGPVSNVSGASATATNSQVPGPGGNSSTSPVPDTSPVSTGTHGCTSPAGTDQGVSTHQIKIALTLGDVGNEAGDKAFGVPDTNEQRADWQDVVDAINASGGVACRQLVPSYFTGNLVDTSSLQTTCDDIQQAQVFAVLDVGLFSVQPSSANCFFQYQVPFITSIPLPQAQQSQGFPYLFSTTATFEEVYRNAVFALKQLGAFDPSRGFRKLGVFYKDCFAGDYTEFSGWLQQAGVTSSDIVTYDDGCPSTPYGNPAGIQQAALTFEQDGVTTVTQFGETGADFATFTKFAQQENYHPMYRLPDDTIIALQNGGTGAADTANFNHAIVVTALREGEQSTPGYVPSAGTAKCDAIFAAHGSPTPKVYQNGLYGSLRGDMCADILALAAAVDHSVTLHRADIAHGIEAAGSIDFPYPLGPDDYRGARVTTGGEYWRPVEFNASCNCFQLLNPKFQPAFP